MAADKAPPDITTSISLELLRPVMGPLLDEVGPLLAHFPLTALDTLTLGDLLALSGHTADPPLLVVVAGLFGALNEGSVCLQLSPAQLSRFGPPDQVSLLTRHLDRFNQQLAAGAYVGLVDEAENVGSAPLIRVRRQGGADRPDLLYFQRFFKHERRLEKKLVDFLDQDGDPLHPPDRIDPLMEALWHGERVIRIGTGRIPLTKDPWQQAALRLVLTRRFAVISGGPGTGKTSLMVNMLRLFSACGIGAGDIRLTAPTGRAAQRMREALQDHITGIAALTEGEKDLLGIEAVTLHRLLQFDPRRQRFAYHAGYPLPARVVIADEVSMIDVGMLDRLLQAIDPGHTRLILLGDKDQLPSVQAGAVFAEMVPRHAETGPSDTQAGRKPSGRKPSGHRFDDHLVILQNSYRSGQQLLGLGKTINAGRMPEMKSCCMVEALNLPPDSYALVRPHSEGKPAAALETVFAPWVDHHYTASSSGDATCLDLAADLSGYSSAQLTADHPPSMLVELFSRLSRARILTVARRGPLGCARLNRWVMTDLAARHGQSADPATGLFNGTPILITRNDYGRQLFNGDVGVALTDELGSLRVYIQRGRSVISTPVQSLGSWEPAFATTVHKSQGSEFSDVLLVFPGDPNHRLLSREIFYTGVTRARQRLMLLAHPEELKAALARPIQRSSGLLGQN